MLRPLIHAVLSKAERRLGGSLDYARFIADTSVRLFIKFTKLLSFGNCRKTLPRDVFHVAALVATRSEDCGTCLQIGLNMARADRVPVEHLRAVIETRPDALPEHLADAYRFAEATLARQTDAADLRERLRARYGDAGLIELAFALAVAKTFPTIKWALGYATSCAKVRIDLPQ